MLHLINFVERKLSEEMILCNKTMISNQLTENLIKQTFHLFDYLYF